MSKRLPWRDCSARSRLTRPSSNKSPPRIGRMWTGWSGCATRASSTTTSPRRELSASRKSKSLIRTQDGRRLCLYRRRRLALYFRFAFTTRPPVWGCRRQGKHGPQPMILLLDNYDSFTYNLAQFLGQLGEKLDVVRNDQITVEEIAS